MCAYSYIQEYAVQCSVSHSFNNSAWSGNCNIDVDECLSQACQNGATCTEAVWSYTCACVAGYYGDNCELDIDECASEPCQNGGTCADSNMMASISADAYVCTCPVAFENSVGNEDCAVDIDECASSPCLNGGTCLDELGVFAGS